MKTILLAVLATASLNADSIVNGTVDGVTYTMTYSDGGNNYVDYTWFFSDPVSAYTMSVFWYGAPPTYQIYATYGGVTQQSTENGIPLLTISGELDTSLASIEYDTNELNFLTIKFESTSNFNYPSLTFTSLTDPPLQAQVDPPVDAPEPGTIALTALGLFALDLVQRWLRSRRNRLALCARHAPRAAAQQPCR